MKKKWIYDIETFPNFFCIVFKYDTESKHFELSLRKNQIKELKDFLSNLSGLIGYNNLSYDYPILDIILKTKNEYITNDFLYNKSQEIINSEYSNIKNPLIPQLDLFLIHHYNNPARACSLKWLEFSLRWQKVQDLPLKFDQNVPIERFDDIITYCYNDVNFTNELYLKSKNNIEFRSNMSKKLNHNVMNYSDVKIGEYINQITYCGLSGKNYYDFKDDRTYWKSFKLEHIIPKDITFKSKIFNDFFDSIKNESFGLEEDFTRIIELPNISIKFAKGGLHSEDKPRIINNTKGYLSELDIGLTLAPLIRNNY